MQTKILSLAILFAFLLLVVELVRREKLTFKYAVGWMTLSLVGCIFIVFDSVLFSIAYLFGFELPSNFIFFTLLSFFVFLSLLLTTFLCQQDRRNETMAQKIGILEMEVKQLKENRHG